MDRRLRILHTADSHIGAALPARPRQIGPRRGDDLVDSFSRALDAARAHAVDLVIHAGDLFDSARPSARALAAAAEPLLRVAAGGTPVVIVPGNHERSAIPAALLLAHRNIHIVHAPRTLRFAFRGLRVFVAGFPCVRHGAESSFAQALEATQWSREPADVRILAVHQTFESATCGPGAYRFRSGEGVVERHAVPAAFDYVAAGHIHRHQVLATRQGDGPPIVYAGSPDRVSFAEIDEPKGFVLVEERDGRLEHHFIEHEVRPMRVQPLDVSGLARAQIVAEVEAYVDALPPRALAQVRLAGCATRGALRGLGLAARAREARPDVVFTVSAQAVEFVPERSVPSSASRARPAFAGLALPAQETVCVAAQGVAQLPSTRGVYALRDATQRLLYVGKAANIRARVRTHLRGRSGARLFDGWGRQIAWVEACPTHSDLEALLIEAELIRRLRPAFNRQLRRWTGYCYLAENGMPHHQLVVCRAPSDRRRCFGPFRGRRLAEMVRDAVAVQFGLAACPDEPRAAARLPLLQGADGGRLCGRYYAGVCCGPCAGRVSDAGHAERLRRRDALLEGVDDESLRSLEAQVESLASQEVPDLRRRVRTLRGAFDHCATLHAAERCRNGLLLMPGPPGARTVAVLGADGLHLERLHDSEPDGLRLIEWYQRLARGWADRLPRRLSVAAMDSLCIVARQLRRETSEYHFIPRDEMVEMGACELLRRAFRCVRVSHPPSSDYSGASHRAS